MVIGQLFYVKKIFQNRLNHYVYNGHIDFLVIIKELLRTDGPIRLNNRKSLLLRTQSHLKISVLHNNIFGVKSP